MNNTFRIKLKHKLIFVFVFLYAFVGIIVYMSRDIQTTFNNDIGLLNDYYAVLDANLQVKEYLEKDVEIAKKISEALTDGERESNQSEHTQIESRIFAQVDSIKDIQITNYSDLQIYNFKVKYKENIGSVFNKLNTIKIQELSSGMGIGEADSKAKELQATIDKVVALIDKDIKKIDKHISTQFDASTKNIDDQNNYLLIFTFLLAFVSILIILVAVKLIFNPLNRMVKYVEQLSKGNLDKELDVQSKDEIGFMGTALSRFVQSIKTVAIFLNEIGEAKFDNEYELLSDKDELGKAFVKMRNNLKQANDERIKMKKQEDLQNWATTGIAMFGNILRQQVDDNHELAYNIIKGLIEYVDANQGGLFILDDESEKAPYLELMATYAYGRKKFKESKVRLGEGLVGICALEAQTIHMTNIPDDYIEIESYLGHASPRSLIIVPLKMDDKLFGVIEIASFTEFDEHTIKFIEDLAETIASSLSTAKINARTAQLLEKSKEQSEAMLAQEEEMRQNLEELQSTQEEAARREKFLNEELERANEELERLRAES